MNIEYIIPLFYGIRLATFYDVGNVYGFATKFDLIDLRQDAGVGLRWQSPFGPVRLDLGFKLDRRKGESSENFNFSAGSPF